VLCAYKVKVLWGLLDPMRRILNSGVIYYFTFWQKVRRKVSFFIIPVVGHNEWRYIFNMPDVMIYKEYRQFMLDYLTECKETHSWYSLRYFAGKINMDHGNLVRVLQGQRGLPERNLEQCVAVMQLTGRKAEYFRLLVRYQKARNPEKASSYLERLLTLAGKGSMKLEAKQFEFYRHWHHTAIYHVLGAFSCTDDYAGLGKKLTPPVSAGIAEKSVQLLLDLGLVERGTDGVLNQSSIALTTGEAWESSLIHNFQKQSIEMALNSLQKHPRTSRDFSTLSMGVQEKDIAKIKDILRQARAAIIDVVKESDPVDCVYHLNVQLFPMAFTEKRKV
jgi:uncharacterized protein (TIGR02147 family)